MRADIIERLRFVAREEERSLGARDGGAIQSFYGRPGRFIIERRRVSYMASGRTELPISLHVHPTSLYFPEHSHDYIEVMYVLSGSITHEIGGEGVTVSAGDSIIFGRAARHSIRKTEEGDLGINLIISTELYEKMLTDTSRASSIDTAPMLTLLEEKEPRHLVIESSKNRYVDGVLELLVEAMMRGDTDRYIIEATASLFLCHLASSASPSIGGSREMRLTEYIRTSYASATLTEAAELLGFSETYLSRWCSRSFGVSFKEMLMDERFRAACELLERTEMSVGEIISTVGYENSSYFHREFKKRLGTTPSIYRRSKATPH